MFSAHDVARELRERLPQAGVVKIHKLAYYCQGWQLAWSRQTMFPETIEAWTNGPVVADLWHSEKKNWSRPAEQQPDDSQVAVIDYVTSRYGRFTGRELIRMTHIEDPWRDVSESDDSTALPNPEITHEALLTWFCRDDEYLAHQAEVAKLSQRRDIYAFEGPAIPDDLRAATLQAIGLGAPKSGQR